METGTQQGRWQWGPHLGLVTMSKHIYILMEQVLATSGRTFWQRKQQFGNFCSHQVEFCKAAYGPLYIKGGRKWPIAKKIIEGKIKDVTRWCTLRYGARLLTKNVSFVLPAQVSRKTTLLMG